MRLAFFVSDGYGEYNSSNYRVSIPVSAIQRSEFDMRHGVQCLVLSVKDWLKQNESGRYACSMSDVIIVQRVMVDAVFEVIEHWRKRGKAIVVDFDDAYDLIRDDNAAYKFWGAGLVDVALNDGVKYTEKMQRHPIEHFKMGLPKITGIVTPSRRLSADWDRYTKGFYLPNYLDIEQRYMVQKRNNETPVIGWGGSLSHVPSFTGSGVIGALRSVTQNFDTTFMLVGDRRIEEHLGIAENKYLYHPYVKADAWPYILARYDIGLAPLFDKYDCRRSALKVQEYIAMGIPFVATKSVVYEDYFGCESGIFIDQGDLEVCDESNEDAWQDAMAHILDNLNHYRQAAAHEADVYRDMYDVDMNVENIIDVYKNIVEHNERLLA